MVIDIMATKIRSDGLDVKTVFHPAEIKGYVFAEGTSGAVHKAVQGLMHIRGVIDKPVPLDDIKHFLETERKDRIRPEEANIVEIIGGPFKGEKGRITRVDSVKDEVTIELLDASIPIPVTIATEFIKILKRTKNESQEEKE